MSFNLESLSLKDTFTLHLRHPATDVLLYADEAKTQPVQIVLHSIASEAYRNAALANSDSRLQRGRKAVTAAGLQNDGVELLVACSIEGVNIQYQGNDLASDTIFRAIYSDKAYVWLKDQVDAAIGEVGNFLEQSSKS